MNVNRANVRPGKASVNDGVSLVHRLLNPFGFAAGQLAVFQGASVAPSSRLAGGPFWTQRSPRDL